MIDMPRLDFAGEYVALLAKKKPLDDELKTVRGTADFKKQFADWLKGLSDKSNAKVAATISKKKVAQWGVTEKNLAQTHYLENVYPGAAELRKVYLPLKRREAQLVRTGSKVMVMAEMATPRQSHILTRGAYDQPTTPVTANTPSFLPGFSADRSLNRLELARWLIDRQNPLTARVAVNRLWELFFGVGLVKTQEDFGSQGEPPSHPDLLDHLGWRFRESGWDVKAMLKYIVTSAVYQQSSKGSTESYLIDPENRLLSRGPRYRLPGQIIRDQALAAAGLLVGEIGGAPVKPYQPVGLWKEIIKGRVVYKRDTGEKLYRRSLYTLWRRAVKPPEMMLFDANERDTCSVNRKRTNTPLQALMLLNDETFVEAARSLGARMIRAGGDCPDCRFENGMQFVLGRSPTTEEMNILRQEFYASFARFRDDPDAAKKFLSEGESMIPDDLDEGELAGYTVVARILLNLDETLTKE